MIEIELGRHGAEPKSALFLGAHCDDIEIGCGGTMLWLASRYPNIRIDWVVFASNEVRAAETTRCQHRFLAEHSNKSLIFHTFRNGYFPHIGAEIKDSFETLKAAVAPDLIFTHFRDDRHQDHRTISELTWNTFRSHLILEYEIPKYDGDSMQPNFFCPLTAEAVGQKCDYLQDCYVSQLDKQWFTPDTFRGLARLRGIECDAQTGFAEAFYCRKMAVGGM